MLQIYALFAWVSVDIIITFDAPVKLAITSLYSAARSICKIILIFITSLKRHVIKAFTKLAIPFVSQTVSV